MYKVTEDQKKAALWAAQEAASGGKEFYSFSNHTEMFLATEYLRNESERRYVVDLKEGSTFGDEENERKWRFARSEPTSYKRAHEIAVAAGDIKQGRVPETPYSNKQYEADMVALAKQAGGNVASMHTARVSLRNGDAYRQKLAAEIMNDSLLLFQAEHAWIEAGKPEPAKGEAPSTLADKFKKVFAAQGRGIR